MKLSHSNQNPILHLIYKRRSAKPLILNIIFDNRTILYYIMIPKTYYIKNQRITLPDNLILDKNIKLIKKSVLDEMYDLLKYTHNLFSKK